MIEIYPDTEIELHDLIVILFGVDGGNDQPVLKILSSWFQGEKYEYAIGIYDSFDPSPDLEGCEVDIVMDGIYDIPFQCGYVDGETGDIDLGWGKFTIKDGKIDRFLFEEI